MNTCIHLFLLVMWPTNWIVIRVSTSQPKSVCNTCTYVTYVYPTYSWYMANTITLEVWASICWRQIFIYFYLISISYLLMFFKFIKFASLEVIENVTRNIMTEMPEINTGFWYQMTNSTLQLPLVSKSSILPRN